MSRGVGWAVRHVAQLRQWLEEDRKPPEMRATRQTGRWRAPSHTSQRTNAFLKQREIQLTCPPCSPDLSPLDFHLWQEWETALGDRQFTSQLELRAMIVPTVSALDPHLHLHLHFFAYQHHHHHDDHHHHVIILHLHRCNFSLFIDDCHFSPDHNFSYVVSPEPPVDPKTIPNLRG